MNMKANELMIGDWVNINLSPDSHDNIFPTHITIDNLIALERGYDVKIEPIPLTEAILKANGWEVLSNYSGETYYSEDGEFGLDFHNGKFRLIIRYRVVIIDYVHQLQHILHLCGLTDLADNFTIK